MVMKYWKIIADNLSKAGWSWGFISAVDSNGRTIFVGDAMAAETGGTSKNEKYVRANCFTDVGKRHTRLRCGGQAEQAPVR